MIYAPANQYSVILELLPKYQRTPGRAVEGVPAFVARHAGAARYGGAHEADDGPLQINHFGQLARGDDLVQPAAGIFAWARPPTGGQRDPRNAACRPRSPPASRAR